MIGLSAKLPGTRTSARGAEGAAGGAPPGGVAVEAEDDRVGEADELLHVLGRARGAERRHGVLEAGLGEGDDVHVALDDLAQLPVAELSQGRLLAALGQPLVERAAGALSEPKHAFAVAQAFHSYYQQVRYSVLRAENEELRAFRALVVDAFVRQMEALTGLLGIPLPERM